MLAVIDILGDEEERVIREETPLCHEDDLGTRCSYELELALVEVHEDARRSRG